MNSFLPTYKFTEGLTFFGSVLIVNAVNEFFRGIMGESIQVSVCEWEQSSRVLTYSLINCSSTWNEFEMSVTQTSVSLPGCLKL